ncbi:MAG: 2-dehydropantoate 2-reductase [Chloroflexi bacterium]|nr:2-dehydropantoate 2-reductase [Chloroflexota bacterium]
MARNIAVLGTGAIGSSIAADLTRAGYDVILIDQWPAHVEAMKANGLRVTMPEEEFVAPVRAFHLCEMKDLHRAPPRQLDLVFLACKSYDTTWLVEFIKPFLKPDGVLVSTQNSINDEWIIPIIGRGRDMPCVVEVSAEVFEPGLVRRNSDRAASNFWLGEHDGRITSRLQEVAQILSSVGQTHLSTNIWGAKWTKLMFNSMRATPRAVLGALRQDMRHNPELLDLETKIGREAAQVGTALGHALEPILGLTPEDFRGLTDELFRKVLLSAVGGSDRSVLGHGDGATSMIQQDILKGRLTETDYLNGLIARKGREAGLPTPANEAVAAVMRQIAEGELQPSLSNLRILQEYMSGKKAMA